ncbi:MAG: cyclic lactone autoinducer peptide [Roseburia inulinivorans]
MKDKNRENFSLKGVAKVLETTLKVEANSTSCLFMYQPKTPKKVIQI